jgi:hypothetical protein
MVGIFVKDVAINSDQGIINFIKSLPCLLCNTKQNIAAHHVTTRGAGGLDSVNNLMPLCIVHHREFHDKGIMQMIKIYPQIYHWLIRANRNDIINKFNYREVCNGI